MPETNNDTGSRAVARRRKLRFLLLTVVIFMLSVSAASTQNPVFNINIDQAKLLNGQYPVSCVLEAGGQFWTTPYTQYNAATGQGDGYGEGPKGPRSGQRKIFNPSGFPVFPFLRLNGLDSQSCYECHNSIGSDPGYGAGSPLIRKPTPVGGSAGFNSNAFINPCFPKPLTLLIRQPPHVFGSGYVQALADEIDAELYALRCQVRKQAMADPGKPKTIELTDAKHNLKFGTFKTTYNKGSNKWNVVGSINGCANKVCSTPAAAPPTPENDPCAPVAAGFTDDVSKVTGVAQDLIVRPFQWKGIASSLRHFVRDALDFHLSMQAVEKVGACDCDVDGKTNEVTVGNVSAIASFVGMTRPPQQIAQPGTEATVTRGYQIFTGTLNDPKVTLSGQMCATCHVPSLPLVNPNPQYIVDTPPVPNFDCKTGCPVEAVGSYTSLVSPIRSYSLLPALQRVKTALGVAPAAGAPAPQQNYNIPLNSANLPGYALPRLSQSAPSFLPFLPQPPAGAFYVPLFSDLQTHNMGTGLIDLAPQGLDVAGICAAPAYFVTRPLWGVADTGPWLHDGRATSLLEAIMLHGNSSTGSDAGKIIDAFTQLSTADKQAVIDFLLTLRLPTEQSMPSLPACQY